MRHSVLLHSAWVAALLCETVLSGSSIGLAQPALAQPGQSFAGSAEASGVEGGAAGLSTPEGSLYADGTRAINEGRWADAEAIFSKVAAEHGSRADGEIGRAHV